MIYTLDGELHLQDVPTPLLHQLIQELTVPNPKFQNALRLGRPTYNIPETVMLYEIKGNALTLPRAWQKRSGGRGPQALLHRSGLSKVNRSILILLDFRCGATSSRP